jgi:serine/threonine protein kinase
VEALARVQHPNIAQIYDVGEHGGRLFWSMEYCGGGSLESRLGGRPLPAHDAAMLVWALAQAMHAAHEQGLVHGDLRPAKVLFGEDGRPKIVDLGFAKKLNEGSQNATGAVLGSPSYMAPEQAGGKGGRIGPATDVYALGSILYELLIGRPPFKAATSKETIAQLLSSEPAPPRLLQCIPRKLDTICPKCLHKEPHKRYASALALAQDLSHYLNGEAITARPTAAWERVWKWARRRPPVAALLVFSALSVLVLLVGGGMYAAALRADRDREAQLRQLAEENLNRSLKVVNDMLTEVRTVDMPQRKEIRMGLVNRAEELFRKVSADSGRTP